MKNSRPYIDGLLLSIPSAETMNMHEAWFMYHPLWLWMDYTHSGLRLELSGRVVTYGEDGYANAPFDVIEPKKPINLPKNIPCLSHNHYPPTKNAYCETSAWVLTGKRLGSRY